MSKIKPGKLPGKKDVIIKKASLLFRTKGFKAASMKDVAIAVGVEAPSLYNHIGGKSELLQVSCFKVAAAFLFQLNEVEKTTASIITKIELVLRFHIKMMLENFDEVYVANHEWKHLPPDDLAVFLQQRRSYENRLVALIEEGIEKKEVKPVHPYVTVLTLLSAVRGIEFWLRHKKKITAEALENDMITHLLTGIKK